MISNSEQLYGFIYRKNIGSQQKIEAVSIYDNVIIRAPKKL